MSNNKYAAELKAYIKQYPYRMFNHPFVDGVAAGRITREQLKGWVIQEGHYRRAVPRLSTLRYLICTDPEIKPWLAEVMAEENEGVQSGSAGHYVLYIKLAKALGASQAELEASEPMPGPAAHVYWAELILHTEPWFLALTPQLASEGQNSPTVRRLYDGLKTHYGLSDDELEFYGVHEEADKDHGNAAETIVDKYIVNEPLLTQAKALVKRKLDLHYQMRDSYKAF